MIRKVKDWLKHKPLFEVVFSDEDGNQSVKRLSDGAIFVRMCFYYKYDFLFGQQYYYDIMSFNKNRKDVEIRVYDEQKRFTNQCTMNINNLLTPIKDK